MILVSIGANLPGPDGAAPLTTCRRAAAALDTLPGLRLRGLSRWFATAPVLRPGAWAGPQPDYVNAVAHLTVESGAAIDPGLLLQCLKEREAAAGRVHAGLDAPRVLDLDIIAIGSLVRLSPDPILPHPRADERAFVLVPLADVAPGWVHPVLGQPVQALIARLPPQEIRALGAGQDTAILRG